MLNPNAMSTYFRVKDILGACSIPQTRVEWLINAISNRIETICGRTLGYKIFPVDAPEQMRGDGSQELFLSAWPIKTLVSVTVNGIDYPVIVVSNVFTGLVPLQGLGAFRTPEWDAIGKIYCPIGWPLWAQQWQDLSRDADVNYSTRTYNIQLVYAGGYVLPQFSGKTDVVHNPDHLATDFPPDLEYVIASEIDSRSSGRGSRLLQSQRSPAGGELKWDTKWTGEFLPESLATILTYRVREAIF